MSQCAALAQLKKRTVKKSGLLRIVSPRVYAGEFTVYEIYGLLISLYNNGFVGERLTSKSLSIVI